MPTSGRASRVIVISLMKSGTHLVKELMLALGYGVYGHVRVTPDCRPVLDSATRVRIAGLVHGPERAAALAGLPEPQFLAATDQAWEALAWSWQQRLGIPLVNLYGTELVNSSLVADAVRRSAGSRFADTPEGVCWMLHEFDVKRIDANFLHEWAETGEPRIIFNYRDPRDTMLSLVNFLCGETGRGLSAFRNLSAFSRILLSMPSLEQRLTYALKDDSFPCQDGDYRRMAWLLHHPDVCATSFEELVGPNGGGSREVQVRAVKRLSDFLGADERTPEDIVDTLYNPGAFSFFQGQIGAWRDVFTAEHRRLADERFGEVLTRYGYE
ncbi:hypothetical protein Dvina_18695 [Dactylosporangium vinaceum]|uniref:Sulfotransferase domain-containing protein n=1 Tax=Dactylosporangium vinaceum TaxID=53362 RepID=A0ABV5MT06_9ACTN|nr:sulfotransferase domain-containing protein [Dactylosporangium vinaceum]UAB99904.1 hypothetical protein Dvina_18695 [Dactylosporangium vinaceum]